MRKDDITKAFDSLIAKEENEKNKNRADFVEDAFELSEAEEKRDYLTDYNKKHGFISKLLSILIYLLIIVIIYQIFTIISYYI